MASLTYLPGVVPAPEPDISPWLGVWCPDSSHTEDADKPEESARGEAPSTQPPKVPVDAAYTLLADKDQLRSHIEWTDGDGARQQHAFALPLDGAWLELGDGAGFARLRWHDPVRLNSLSGRGSSQSSTDLPERQNGVVGPTLTAPASQPRLPLAVLITEVCDTDQRIHHVAERRLHGDVTETRMSVVERQRDAHGGWTTTQRQYRRTRVKQVICYRRDLKMRKGKIAAQCAHAAMAVFLERDVGGLSALHIPVAGAMAWWTRQAFAKVVLSVEDEDALLAVHAAARAAGLPTAVVTDSGRTEFKGVPTRTTVVVGPAPVPWIDRITGRDGLIPTKLA